VGRGINLLSHIAPKQSGKLLLKLLLKPRGAPIEQNKLDFLLAAQNFNFEMHDEKYTAYHWPGKGQAILLLHGWESNSSRWRPLIKKLRKKDFNIFALDAPAHGQTSGKEFTPVMFAEAADHIIKEQNIDILLGHSAGGFAALYYLSAFPHKLNKIVALAPTYSMEDVFAGMQKVLKLNPHALDTLRTHFIKVYDIIPSEFNSAKFVSALDLPALLIHDENDMTLPVLGSDAIAKVWNNCRYEKTSGLGHRLRHASVDTMIIDFISE